MIGDNIYEGLAYLASLLFNVQCLKSYNKLNFQAVPSNTISNLIKACNINKAAGIDKVSGRFLKDGDNMLAIPSKLICNLSFKISHFPKDQESFNPCTKKILRQILNFFDQSHFYQSSLKLMRNNTRPSYEISNGQ